MSKRDDVLKVLAGGPVLYRQLLNGRKAGFRLAYRRLLASGEVEESGTGYPHDPRYVGLRGAEFPASRPKVRAADLQLLVRSGMSPDEARTALSGATGEADVIALCGAAQERILERGGDALAGLPLLPDRKVERSDYGHPEPKWGITSKNRGGRPRKQVGL
jgi:hypothetical protein